MDCTIYSRTDRVLGNLDWLISNVDSTLTVIAPNVSDHTILHLKGKAQGVQHRNHFQLKNYIMQMEVYHKEVE